MMANFPFTIVNKKAYFLLSFLFFSYQFLGFQYQSVDSLQQLLQNGEFENDSIQLEIFEELFKNATLSPEVRLKYAKVAYDKANSLENSRWLFKTNLQLGHIYKKIGDLEQSFSHYMQGLREAEKQKDNKRIALIYSSLGTLYRVGEDYDKAIKNYKLGINYLRKGKTKSDSTNLAKSLMNTGEFYRILGKYDSANLYFEESAIIFQQIDYLMGTAYTIGNMGLVHAQKGEHQIAKIKMDSASAILEKLGDFYPIAVYDTYLADIYKENNDLERAIEYANHSLKIAKEHSLKEQIRDANLKLSELYSAQKDYQKAYHHQSQYLVYRDSINNEENIREIADLRTEYEVSKREAEIELLRTEQKNQYIIFTSMAVIILLLAIASFLYYRNSRRKQTLNLILKERKEEAEAQRDQLEAINETREKFLSIIAHDLMGPVNSFKGLSTIMKMSLESQNIKDLNDIHSVFDKSVNNLSSLLTNLLDWSVTQQGDIPYNPEKLDFNKLIKELIDLFFNMAEAKKISLRTEISNNLHLWADANSVKTILRNLVSNALKFTDEGGEILISATKNNSFTVIKVKDNGIGMPQSKIDMLLAENNFEISQGTKGEKGVGLGLQLVKEFVAMNKGKMEIESKIDKGTTFSVYLPSTAPKKVQADA
ncbi:tetratricopeptide repeat-containing sensor histidine kinase [Marivirga sp.]|uniref:tetratricopeptide repeat-containing sensor histidine kinase n=1 Tax=Marivirga sp. TaxID=2018662 RepID=UPI003DA6EF2A